MNKAEVLEIVKSCLPNGRYGIKVTKPRWIRSWGGGYYVELVNPEGVITGKYVITQKILDRVDIKCLKRIFTKGMEIYDPCIFSEIRDIGQAIFSSCFLSSSSSITSYPFSLNLSSNSVSTI